MKLVAAALAFVVACKGGEKPRATPHRKHDPHSQSEPDRIVVTHLSLDLSVDFATRTFTGTAKLSISKNDANASAASRRFFASRFSTLTTSSSVSCRACLPATSSLVIAVNAIRSVAVLSSSRALMAVVRSAWSRSFKPIRPP